MKTFTELQESFSQPFPWHLDDSNHRSWKYEFNNSGKGNRFMTVTIVRRRGYSGKMEAGVYLEAYGKRAGAGSFTPTGDNVGAVRILATVVAMQHFATHNSVDRWVFSGYHKLGRLYLRMSKKMFGDQWQLTTTGDDDTTIIIANKKPTKA